VDDALPHLLARVPEGWSRVAYDGRAWSLTRSTRLGGQVLRLYAEELGGTGVVSANLYLLQDEWVLKPCEMPAEAVLAFLAGWVPSGPA
jgi:peptide-methionine (S)-S-oxide reductase